MEWVRTEMPSYNLLNKNGPILTRFTPSVCKVSKSGNPGMHMPELVGIFPGMESMATHMMMQRMEKLDIPPVPEFLEIIKAAGGRIFACKLAMEMFQLTREDLWEELDDVLTVGQFYNRYTPGSQIVFI